MDDQLKDCRLTLALPRYGGVCNSIFAQGLADLAYIAGQRSFHVGTFYCLNESLIPRACNTCVANFLHSDCTHLMFIDADIGFRGKCPHVPANRHSLVFKAGVTDYGR